MSPKLISAVAIGCLAVSAGIQAQDPATGSFSDVARMVAAKSASVKVPRVGRAKAELNEESPRFPLPGGDSTAVLLELEDYQAPYIITITSSRRGIGRTTELFVPTGVVFDADFTALAVFREDSLRGRIESVAAELPVGDSLRRARYLLLYTNAALIGQQLVFKGQDALDGAIVSLFQKGLFRVERSLDAKLQIDTKLRLGYTNLRAGTMPEIARSLVDAGSAIVLPATGKTRHTIAKDAPTFTLGGGPSTVVIFRLPEYRASYRLTVKSSEQRSGIFVPRGVFLDEAFQPVVDFDESRLSGVNDLVAELAVGSHMRRAQYLLLYTRGDVVGFSVPRGRMGLISSELHWTERSLDAKLEIETGPLVAK